MGYKIKMRNAKSREPGVEVAPSSFARWVARCRPWAFSVAGVGAILLISVVGLFFLRIRQGARVSALEYEASQYFYGEKKDLQKARELYQKIREEYPKNSVAPLATYYAGNLSFELKEYDRAIALYREFVDRYAQKKEFLPLVYLRLGYTYEAKGEQSEALKSFKMVSDLSETRLKDQAFYEMGRIYEAMDVKAEAIAHYESVTTQFVGSPWATEALARLQVIRPVPAQTAPESPEESSAQKPEPLGPAFPLRPDHTPQQ